MAPPRLLRACALLLCLAAHCSAQDVFSGYFAANTTAKKQALAAAKATLNGLTLNCAVYTILQNTSWAPENVTYGDGFAHLTGFSSNRLVPTLRAANPDAPNATGGPLGGRGYSLRTQANDVDGASVWMMKWVQSQTNMTLNIDVVRLPGDIYYGTSKNDTAARVIYMLDTMGYDCVIGTVFIQPQRMQFMRYVISHQPYGYQVVTHAPVYVPESIRSRLFKWALPFTRNLWITIACSVIASAALMTFFEHNTEGEDFPLQEESWGRKVARAMYYSAMGVSTVDNFHPKTNEGRMYVAVKAFVFFVIMSSYTAQLTAILANTQVPSQDITSIASFEATGAPVCVRQNAAQEGFLATFYPQLTVKPIPGLTQAGLLPAIASGVCKGGVGPDPELKYALGGPGIFDADGFDPLHSFCKLQIVGERLTFGYYGIPFKKNDTATVNAATLHAISVLMDQAIDQGNYTISAANTAFPLPDERPICSAEAADLQAAIDASTSEVLQLEDMSGLFIMEGAALVLAVIIRFRRNAASAVKARRAELRARLAMSIKSGRMDPTLGGEMRPAWEVLPEEAAAQLAAEGGELGGMGLDTHPTRRHVEGGMEGRLMQLVTEQTAELSGELEALRHRLDVAAERETAFQKAVLEGLAKRK